MNAQNFLCREQTVVLRGLAALLIAVFHVFLSWNFPRIFNVWGSVEVAVFLFLSGYGLQLSYKKNKLTDFWKKRFRRVILPYWLFLFVLTACRGVDNWQKLLLDAFFIQSDFWFIPHLVQTYLVYYLLQRFCPRFLYQGMTLFALFTLLLPDQLRAEQAFSFLAGILAAQHIDWLRQRTPRQLCLMALACFLWGSALMLFKMLPAVRVYMHTLIFFIILLLIKLPLGASMLILPTIMPQLTRSRLLVWAGRASLEIYLVHLAFIPQLVCSFPSFLLFLAESIVGTVIFYQFNRRIIARIGQKG